MSIISSDPLAFLTAQGGVVGTPLSEAGASGADNLDQKQRSAVVGEPIPIVFCRRVSGTGGVLISPPATEARFEDDASSNITASYHLVLSEGQIDSIQVRDVFQGACRVGGFTQTYDRRAGTFVAGNFIDNTPNLEAPTYCGTSGTYTGLSTMAFSVTIPAGFDQWDRQVHAFIRGGIYVSRLLDSVTGPSNNVADLLLYLLRNGSRVPESMIDTATSFLAAATFTNANGFWFNGVVSESTNLRDWISNTLQYFLLRQARIGGKEALKPLVPINSNGTIKTTAVSWVFTFTEQHIIPDSFEITYTPLADRKPFCATVLWRQQDDLGIPVMRTAEVRYTGTAVDGPYEQHDLSGFCSSENHAVKVGAYIISKRKHVTHRLQIGVKPDAFNPTLGAGDLVRVRLDRIASTGAVSVHDYLYEVDRIGKSITGEVQLDLTHFPVDAARASLVAQEVNDATGSGLLLDTGLSGITCDINSFSDTSVPAETFTDGSFPDYDTDINNRNYSCKGVAAIQFSFEVFNGSNTVTWYNARLVGTIWRYYFPVGSNTEVFQGLGAGQVRSVRNTGCGGNGSGGQLDGNSLDGFAEAGGFDGASDGGDPTEDNLDDGIGGQSTPSGAQPTLTSNGDIDAPVVGDTLTAPVICAGGEVVFYRLDPTVEGGRVFLGGGPTYTLVINDVDYSVYSETRCPDPTSPTGYGEPIASGPTGPVDEWRRFTQTGEFAAYRTVNQTITALYNCSEVLIQNATSQVDGPFFYAARNNVVGYRLGVNTSVITYVCPPTSVDTNTVTMGVSVLYSNNTSEFIGTTLPNGNRTPNQTGTRTEVWTFSITVGGTPIYP
jgi:hypothetical protein